MLIGAVQVFARQRISRMFPDGFFAYRDDVVNNSKVLLERERHGVIVRGEGGDDALHIAVERGAEAVESRSGNLHGGGGTIGGTGSGGYGLIADKAGRDEHQQDVGAGEFETRRPIPQAVKPAARAGPAGWSGDQALGLQLELNGGPHARRRNGLFAAPFLCGDFNGQEIVPQKTASGAGFQMAGGLERQRAVGLLRQYFFELLTIHSGHTQ